MRILKQEFKQRLDIDIVTENKFHKKLLEEMLDTIYPLGAAAGVLKEYVQDHIDDDDKKQLFNEALAIFNIAYKILCDNEKGVVTNSDGLNQCNDESLFTNLWVKCGLSLSRDEYIKELNEYDTDIIGYIEEAYTIDHQ